MIVIHGFWRECVLTLWGEDATAEKRTRAAEHPFAATVEDLAATIGGPAVQALAGVADLSLPTRGGVRSTLPNWSGTSPEAERAALTLASWQVPALLLDPTRRWPCCGRSRRRDTCSARTCGTCVKCTRFAADLVGRGRLLPTVDGTAPGGVATRCSTGSTRSGRRPSRSPCPRPGRAAGRPAGTVVGAALDALVDATARARWTGRRRRSRRRPAHPPGGPGSPRSPVPAATFTADHDAPAELAAGAGRLAARRAWPGGCAPASVWSSRPTRSTTPRTNARSTTSGHRLAAGVRAAGGRRAEPGRGRRAGLAAPRRPRALAAACSTIHRRHCWPSWAGPAGSTPQLDDALRTARPAALELDAAGAHGFLRDGRTAAGGRRVRGAAARLVEQARARLGRPAAPPPRPRPARCARAARSGSHALVDYQWELALGDEPLTEAELAALTDAQGPAGPAARAVGRARPASGSRPG